MQPPLGEEGQKAWAEFREVPEGARAASQTSPLESAIATASLPAAMPFVPVLPLKGFSCVR
ncbi:hypothetical protein [Comamonas flocculans]|uniref:Uncharacterized protein n=1 Tax=Comamonas flocculans TaxID=2597701 RepID=A0A5B8RXH4_9BURK|nr:hypothetical protein [Comamonas flocculans]QEA14200.1 hypothetical protein FOZ74_14830 [Comamonas flocculans]